MLRIEEPNERALLTSTKLGTQKSMSLLVSILAFITVSGSGNIAGLRGSNAVTTNPDVALKGVSVLGTSRLSSSSQSRQSASFPCRDT